MILLIAIYIRCSKEGYPQGNQCYRRRRRYFYPWGLYIRAIGAYNVIITRNQSYCKGKVPQNSLSRPKKLFRYVTVFRGPERFREVSENGP